MTDLREALLNSSESVELNSLLEESMESSYAVDNLDLFLTRVYNYFVGKGFYCILLRHVLNLLTILFTILFATFLVSFIDYRVLQETNNWNAAVDFHRPLHPIMIVCIIVFGLFWVWQIVQLLRQTKHNWEIKNFCWNILKVSESDIQTMEWRELTQKLALVPRLSLSKDNLTALDVAHRIMRKENYFIALVNKELMDLRMPIPFLRSSFSQPVITKTIEWSLTYSLFNFVFDEHNVVKMDVLASEKRTAMTKRLQRRFILMGLISLFLSPFIFVYLLVYIFFKYGEEVRRTPGSILGSREWTPVARWKFREFNELPHYFQNRLNTCYVAANRYISNFPAPLLTIPASFVGFMAGSVLAVVVVLGLVDDDILVSAELWGRSPLWYAGVLGTILAVCRALIPDDNTIFDPKKDMTEVASHIHYNPRKWRQRPHSLEVRDEFCQLFEFRVVIFLRELLSVIFAPFILIFSLPGCSADILDFFRECTVKIPNIGYVCTCASFEHSEKHGNEKYGAKITAAKATRTRHGKLEKSILTFKVNNPDWNPPADGEEVLGNLASFVENNPDTASTIVQRPDQNLMTQSMSVLHPGSSALFANLATHDLTLSLDPAALSLLHAVQQKYHEVKKRDEKNSSNV